MEFNKLSEYATVLSGFAFDSNFFNNTNGMPLIRIRDIKRGYTETYTTEEYDKNYIVKNGDILIGMDGEFNISKWKSDDALLNQRVCKLVVKNNFDKDFIFYSLPYKLKEIENSTSFATVKHISLKQILNIDIPKYEVDEQKKISKKLNIICDLINMKKEQIIKCDELIKSKFIEMFGNPLERNNNRFFKVTMPEVCEIIDGDRGKNYPKQNEFFLKEYCLFLNAKNVTSSGFDFSNNMYITKEKDELLRNGKLKRGDVVLTTRGTVGNLAFYNDSVPYNNVRINSGMVILRMNHEKVNEMFFIEQFKMQLDNIKIKIANGSAQPQLPISKMNGIKVIIPPIELQNKFAKIVEQIDKQKSEFEKSLKKLEELQTALMQEYFG